MLLENKVAIITGAGTGIGEAIANKFACEGARLALGGLPADPVADVGETLVANGAEAEFHLGDLAEEAEARAREGQYGRPGARGPPRGPPGLLDLHHSHDGLRGKEVYRAHR